MGISMSSPKKKKAPNLEELLSDWHAMNAYLIDESTTEETCRQLLEGEKVNRRRSSTLMRIHSTYARKRYLRERAELTALAR